MSLKQGTLLKNGEYRIEKVLGQGGFGITYLGVQVALDRKVAIKEFFMKGVCERDAETSQVSISNADNKELASRFREKFLKEARSIASLEHRNIVSVIDVFECNGTAYYVMKHLGGSSLADKVKQGALSEADAVRYIRQVASALEFVHSKRMMHLDVKPANILLDDTDSAVLIDFGLAKQYDDAGTQTSTTPVGISHGYAPMEQYRRGGVSSFSPATDIYSLGATLYKLVTGATPPEASDINDDGLPVLSDSISPAVRSAIEAAMQPKRKDRPQSIAEFLEMIERTTGKDESGKSGGSDDCPPLLMGTSVAEVVNESPATDDGETVVENSADTVLSNNSRSCYPERSEGSHPAGSVIFRDKPSTTRSNEREKSPKSASEESQKKHGKTLWMILLLLIAGLCALCFYSVVVSKKYEPGNFTYVDLGLPSGLKWATCNAGAGAPHEYGDYLSWDEAQECGLHIPTKDDFDELLDENNCTWEWTFQGGTYGYKVTSKKNGNSIFLPAAGWRGGTSLYDEGSYGDYWSCTPDESDADYAYDLGFDEGGRGTDCDYRLNRLSVRPVLDK